MGFRHISPVAVERLFLDTGNPRTGETDNQQDAVLALIADQGRKLVRLAKDISELGNNPASSFIVVRNRKSSGMYIAMDGNRRLAAIKLLRSPELAKDTPLYKRFVELHRRSLQKIPAKLQCVEFDSRKEANVWIQRLHDRGLEGAGPESWNSEAKSRFQASLHGKLSLEQQLIDSVRKLESLSENDLKAVKKKVAGTTIRRIIEDAGIRKNLGYEIRDEKILGRGSKKQLASALVKIVLDVARKDIKVGDVYDKAGRQRYLAGFDQGLKFRSTSKEKKSEWNAIEYLLNPEGKATAIPTKKVPKKPSIKIKDRRKLVPLGTSINVVTAKAQHLFDALRKPDVEDMPLLLAFGLRAFIEISCYEYQKKNHLPSLDGGTELHVRIDICAKHLESTAKATKLELKGARVTASSHKDSVYSTNTLNAYMHNPHFMPKASDLISHWDQIQPFLIKLWE